MSAFQRGKTFELKVATMIRRKADSGALRNAGSHANWHRSSDVFTNLPLHVECKDQETVKIKEWFEQADAAASYTQTPTVVFAKDEEILCCLRFNDMLNFLKEIADYKAEVEDLRAPTQEQIIAEQSMANRHLIQSGKSNVPNERIANVVTQMKKQGAKQCRAGHLADSWGYCQQLDCKYSRGYRKPKGKK